ncbi:MAG: hypothetical protein RLZZ546_1085 [Bacteroidota bacterium]
MNIIRKHKLYIISIMNLIRKYKISKALNHLDRSDVEGKIIEFVRDTIYNLKESHSGKTTFYSLSNKYVFSHNKISNIVMVNHDFLFRHNIIKIHTTLLDFEAVWDLILYVLKERFKIKINEYYAVINGNNKDEFIHEFS